MGGEKGPRGVGAALQRGGNWEDVFRQRDAKDALMGVEEVGRGERRRGGEERRIALVERAWACKLQTSTRKEGTREG